MMFKRSLIPGLFILLGMLTLACDKENEAPNCEILAPVEGDYILRGAPVAIKAVVDDEDGRVVGVDFYVDGFIILEDSAAPWQATWEETDTASLGEYTLMAIASDDDGSVASSKVKIIINSEGGFNPELEYGSISDVDGNNYKTIVIGSQEWMAENLRTTRYPDGSPIPMVADSLAWTDLETSDEAYCWFNNSEELGLSYGAIYTYEAARAACPAGWHLPDDGEWKILEMELGMSESEADKHDWRGTDAGNQLKEEGYTNWDYPSGGSNSSGFTALPAGFRSSNGSFYGYYGTFWTASTDTASGQAWFRSLLAGEDGVLRDHYYKNNGYSIRCVKD